MTGPRGTARNERAPSCGTRARAKARVCGHIIMPRSRELRRRRGDCISGIRDTTCNLAWPRERRPGDSRLGRCRSVPRYARISAAQPCRTRGMTKIIMISLFSRNIFAIRSISGFLISLFIFTARGRGKSRGSFREVPVKRAACEAICSSASFIFTSTLLNFMIICRNSTYLKKKRV